MVMRQEGDGAVERGIRDVWKQWWWVYLDERFAAGWLDVIARRAKREVTLDTGGGSLKWWNQMRRQARYRGTACLVDAGASMKYMYLHIRSANLAYQA